MNGDHEDRSSGIVGRTHPDTSVDAALSVRPRRQRIMVFQYIERGGVRGATNEEIHIDLGIKTCAVCPRVNELKRDGLVIDSGRRRPAKSGINVVIWITTPPEQSAARQMTIKGA